MRRQITAYAWAAFCGGYDFKRDNTRVVTDGNTRTMYLYDTAIAKYGRGRLTIQTGGYNTSTTKERLRGLHLYTPHDTPRANVPER